MLPNSDQGLGILFGAVGLGVLLFLAGKAGFLHLSFFGFNFQRAREKSEKELEWEREDQRSSAVTERREVDAAFERYAEAAVGMVPMVSQPGRRNESVERWFDLVAGAIDAAVTKHMGDHFRVAIWADFGDPDSFRLIGCANHNRNDPKVGRLSKEATIGGHAWRSKSGEYLCSDIAKDRKYKQRSPAPRPYRSIFAIRVGDAASPWGVLTIDAPRAQGFTALDLTIIRRFARLISAGATIAVAKYSPGATPSRVTPSGPARIVQSSGETPARLMSGESADDQP